MTEGTSDGGAVLAFPVGKTRTRSAPDLGRFGLPKLIGPLGDEPPTNVKAVPPKPGLPSHLHRPTRLWGADTPLHVRVVDDLLIKCTATSVVTAFWRIKVSAIAVTWALRSQGHLPRIVTTTSVIDSGLDAANRLDDLVSPVGDHAGDTRPGITLVWRGLLHRVLVDVEMGVPPCGGTLVVVVVRHTNILAGLGPVPEFSG